MDWGTNRHQWNNGVRHNKPSSGGSAEDLAGPVLAGWLSAFSRSASHVPYFITSISRQFPYHPPPLRKPAGTNCDPVAAQPPLHITQRRGKRKRRLK